MSLKIDGAPSLLAITQVSVGSTAVQLVAARSGRRKLILANAGYYFGSDSSVTSATGFSTGYFTAPIVLETAAEVWAIGGATPQGVGVIEIYDEEA